MEIRVNGSLADLSYIMSFFRGQPQESVVVLPIVEYGGHYCTIGSTFELAYNLTWGYIRSFFRYLEKKGQHNKCIDFQGIYWEHEECQAKNPQASARYSQNIADK